MNRNKKIILIVFTFIAICGVVICVQAYSNVKKFTKIKYQKLQFNSIQAGIEYFNSESNVYPPSEALDPNGDPYCGAMKLCEAMMGRDMLGFHPDSVFRADGMDATNTRQLYAVNPQTDNTNSRIGPILKYDTGNANRLIDIYGSGNTGSFNGDDFVLCDEYPKKRHSGKKIGMPILYYKANTSNTENDVTNPDNPKNRYNYKDNHALLSLGVPGKPNIKHPLFVNPKIFYEMTKVRNVRTESKHVRADSFVLISAGEDGLYGTADDICNFEWKYRE